MEATEGRLDLETLVAEAEVRLDGREVRHRHETGRERRRPDLTPTPPRARLSAP